MLKYCDERYRNFFPFTFCWSSIRREVSGIVMAAVLPFRSQERRPHCVASEVSSSFRYDLGTILHNILIPKYSIVNQLFHLTEREKRICGSF